MGIQINGTNDTITTNDGTISIDGSTTLTGSLTGTTGVFSGDVGVAGTLTSEDKTNIDSVGLITARTGIKVGPITGVAATHYADGSIRTTGIITATTFSGSAASLTALNANNISAGIVTAARLGGGTASNTKYLRGDGIWDTVTGTTINNNANNKVITGSGTANTLEAEASLLFDAGLLKIDDLGGTAGKGRLEFGNSGEQYIEGYDTGNAGSSSYMTIGAGSSERLRIDSSGHIHTGYATNVTGADHVNILASDGGGVSVAQNNAGNATSGTTIGSYSFQGYHQGGATFASAEARISAIAAANHTGSSAATDLAFYTKPAATGPGSSPTERMRIHAAGNTLLSKSTNYSLESNDATLHVNTPTNGGQGGIYVHCDGQGGGSSSAHYGIKIDALSCGNNADQYGMMIDCNQQLVSDTTGIYCDVYGSYQTTYCFRAHLQKQVGAFTTGTSFHSKITQTASGGSSYHFRGYNGSSERVQIDLGGNIRNTNNSYGSLSDVKLKENIEDAGSQWNDIKSIRVRNFNFIDDPDKVKLLGVVAQEVESISAGLIDIENDVTIDEESGVGSVTGTTKYVKYSVLYMKAVKALQEAMARIETLETKVTSLEGS